MFYYVMSLTAISTFMWNESAEKSATYCFPVPYTLK